MWQNYYTLGVLVFVVLLGLWEATRKPKLGRPIIGSKLSSREPANLLDSAGVMTLARCGHIKTGKVKR